MKCPICGKKDWQSVVCRNTEQYVPSAWQDEIIAAVKAEIAAAEKRGAEIERAKAQKIVDALKYARLVLRKRDVDIDYIDAALREWEERK